MEKYRNQFFRLRGNLNKFPFKGYLVTTSWWLLKTSLTISLFFIIIYLLFSQLLREIEGHDGFINSICFDKEGKKLLNVQVMWQKRILIENNYDCRVCSHDVTAAMLEE